MDDKHIYHTNVRETAVVFAGFLTGAVLVYGLFYLLADWLLKMSGQDYPICGTAVCAGLMLLYVASFVAYRFWGYLFVLAASGAELLAWLTGKYGGNMIEGPMIDGPTRDDKRLTKRPLD